MTKEDIFAAVEKERKGAAFKNYLEVRDAVFRMLAYEPRTNASPSNYWKEELAGFDYMFDASPLIVRSIRRHSYHITGLKDYDYRDHHRHQTKAFERKLRLLQKEDKGGLLVAESPDLGGYGYRIDGALYNLDTLKYYECLIALDRGGILDRFRNFGGRASAVEIGAGWGGFPYQFKTLFPDSAYVLVDFPATFLFSATYLMTLFPYAKFLFVDGSPESCRVNDIRGYDFIFAPHWAWSDLSFPVPDILLNMVSFQEMTDAQVDAYARRAHEWGIPLLYSMNRDRSRHNRELSTVSSILGRYYALQETSVLNISPSRLPSNMLKYHLRPLKRWSAKHLGWPKEKLHHEYRHLIGRLR